MRDNASFYKRDVESREAFYEGELEKQADFHEKAQQTQKALRKKLHKKIQKDLQDSIYKKKLSQAAEDEAKRQSLSATHETQQMEYDVLHMREEIAQLKI